MFINHTAGASRAEPFGRPGLGWTATIERSDDDQILAIQGLHGCQRRAIAQGKAPQAKWQHPGIVLQSAYQDVFHELRYMPVVRKGRNACGQPSKRKLVLARPHGSDLTPCKFMFYKHGGMRSSVSEGFSVSVPLPYKIRLKRNCFCHRNAPQKPHTDKNRLP